MSASLLLRASTIVGGADRWESLCGLLGSPGPCQSLHLYQPKGMVSAFLMWHVVALTSNRGRYRRFENVRGADSENHNRGGYH